MEKSSLDILQDDNFNWVYYPSVPYGPRDINKNMSQKKQQQKKTYYASYVWANM